MLPDRNRSTLERALKEFDQNLRHQAAWKNWDQKKSQLYAIDHGGQLYPPKQIVSLATGVSVRLFSGGRPTNGYLESRGFSIITLDHGEFPAPAELPSFEVGRSYKRSTEITGRFGGSAQSGIAPSSQAPAVFLFTGDSGEQFGYSDRIDDASGVLFYTGEGQQGDMEMTRGNAAIANHASDGRALHVFRTQGKGKACVYLGEYCYGSHVIERGLDRNGNERNILVFRLLPVATTSDVEAAGLLAGPEADGEDIPLPEESLEDLRRRAVEATSARPQGRDPKLALRAIYDRSVLVKNYVLRRSAGFCELCDQEAPFLRKSAGTPYLEPHHINRLSDGGLDHPRYVAALCPNCHRRIHFGVDGSKLNNSLRHRVAALEAGMEP
ncbi:HNH endonuclease [Thauera chlorobenzoica]|uniref:HNH nuclease domain-containing protein n=1 Tax=Thauera chlorobenzoica TaxID=96773 RepID=A0A1H5SF31_9RHOO|nr:HNH endonuclease [Thauera chlorobenzoica]APR04828.1 HNH nuclease domain-containing protein [Thauera chlorobenzoica]SEF49212.1 5-methylcytosine-specific restriction enzyme A [Thauera chlorobenzoica]